MAESSLRRAASPEVTVSTRWPFLRSAISSISQIERVSSHTRILAMDATCFGGSQFAHLVRCRLRGLGLASSAGDFHCKFGAAARCGLRPDLAAVRLHDLVHNRESKPGTAFKARLK